MADLKHDVEVLLVEDNETDAELCIRTLRKHNLANKVVWLKDGAEALDFIFRTGSYVRRPNNLPKLILLDLKLPKVDGMDVLKKIKSDEHTKIIPVVVMTSSNEQRDLVMSYYNGANGFVSKPVEFNAFSDAVAKLGMYWLITNQPPPTNNLAQ